MIRARVWPRVSVPFVRRTILTCAVLAAFVTPARASPQDFTREVRALYAVLACGDAPPPEFARRIVGGHCAQLAGVVKIWKTKWRDLAAPFFVKLLERGTPASVVYPFGGGDLATLLAVYPDATEYTTLSLEGMGDPRPILALGGGTGAERWRRSEKLTRGLQKLRKVLAQNLNWAWNTTNQLSIDSSETGVGIPGILGIALVALAASGYEPVAARFFELAPDGTVGYLTRDRVAAWDAEQQATPLPGKVKYKTNQVVQQGLFNDVEITFRKRGDAKAPTKVFRHIAADLSDLGYEAHRGALAYLDARRDFAAMTKAASYLLWNPEFARLRTVLLARMKLMISDDTGVPPRFARPAGFTQQVWGSYAGAFFKFADDAVEQEMVQLWTSPVEPTIRFRFGYYDKRRKPHLMFTFK